MTDPTPSPDSPAVDDSPETTAEDTESAVRRRRTLLTVGALFVAGGLALGAWALTSAATPVAAPTPSPSVPAVAAPSSSATATAPTDPSSAPVDAATSTPVASVEPSDPVASDEGAPSIPVFTVSPTDAACADEREAKVPLTFAWASEGADRAWIGVGTSDASAQPFAEVPPTADGYSAIAFACRDSDQVFTLTVQGPGGVLSSTIAVSRTAG